MSQALHPMLNVAVNAARKAGSIINRASLDLDILKVTTKSVNDFVTEVDQVAEQAIIETLLTAYPGHGILAEESGRAHGAKNSEYVWIIDPLDGTTNFIHGLPFYAVSIALAHRGEHLCRGGALLLELVGEVVDEELRLLGVHVPSCALRTRSA